MQSRYRLFGHSIHQIVVPFALGLFGAAAVFDGIALAARQPAMAQMAYWLIGGGLVVGLLAAPFGLLDWMATPEGSRAERLGRVHGTGNAVVLLLFWGSWMMRRGDPAAPQVMATVLSFAAVALTLMTAWMGGELVNRLGMGVSPGAGPDAPSSLREPVRPAPLDRGDRRARCRPAPTRARAVLRARRADRASTLRHRHQETAMSTSVTDALHDIHTATNDVLKGYREMASRAQPDIQPVVSRLIDLHQRHADEQAAALARLREEAVGDTSFQGTVNRAVVIMRDWFTDLDRDVLPAIRQGEEALRDEYTKALRDEPVAAHGPVGSLLKTQLQAVEHEIASLPRS